MASGTTIGVDDDLASRQAAVAYRSTGDKTPGGIDKVTGIGVEPFTGKYRINDLLEECLLESIM